MNDGGKPYRAFLEGRIKGDKYCLDPAPYRSGIKTITNRINVLLK